MRKRPLGIAILSIINMIVGIIGFILIFYTNWKSLAHVSVLTLPSILLSLFAIIVGIGMWFAKQWAWYLVCFEEIVAALRETNAFIITLTEQIERSYFQIEELFGSIFLIYFYVSIVTYLFGKNVRQYFKKFDKEI